MRNYTPYHVSRSVLKSREAMAVLSGIGDSSWIEYETEEHGLGVRQRYVDLNREQWGPLYRAMERYVEKLNRVRFRFELTGWQQPLRVSEYGSGYYHDWHMDYTRDDASKLAFSILLSDPDEFEGGEFFLLESGKIPLGRGDGVFFPAFAGHKVSFVTEGTRRVLLGWLTGPRFV